MKKTFLSALALSALTLAHVNAQTAIYTPSASANAATTNPTSGYVGIGTATPGAKLDVNGNVKIASTSPSLGVSIGDNGTIGPVGTNTYSGFSILGQSSIAMIAGTGQRLSLGSNKMVQMEIASDGTIWTGKTVNANGLTVFATGNFAMNGVGTFSIDAPGASAGRLSILANGNVGIGVVTPPEKLVVSGNIKLVNSGNALIFWGGGEKIVGTSDWGIDFQTGSGSTSRLKIMNDGKIGIGTVTPARELEVNGTIRAAGYIEMGTDLYLSRANGYKRALTAGPPTVTGGTDEPLVINSGGDFTGGVKIDGRGLLAKEVCVNANLNWCDYVFDANYKLRKLEEVEKYITENKHLPEIPSSAEVEKEGIKTSEIITLQMKKIEELTLYVIEQNKRLKELESALIKR